MPDRRPPLKPAAATCSDLTPRLPPPSPIRSHISAYFSATTLRPSSDLIPPLSLLISPQSTPPILRSDPKNPLDDPIPRQLTSSDPHHKLRPRFYSTSSTAKSTPTLPSRRRVLWPPPSSRGPPLRPNFITSTSKPSHLPPHLPREPTVRCNPLETETPTIPALPPYLNSVLTTGAASVKAMKSPLLTDASLFCTKVARAAELPLLHSAAQPHRSLARELGRCFPVATMTRDLRLAYFTVSKGWNRTLNPLAACCKPKSTPTCASSFLFSCSASCRRVVVCVGLL